MIAFVRISLMLIVALHVVAVRSQTIPLSTEPDAPYLVLTAGAELAYAYSLNEPVDGKISYVTVPSVHNSFMLTMGRLSASVLSSNIRGTTTLHFGSFVDANYTGADVAWKVVQEAHGGFRITDQLWVDGGILPSHIGIEGMVGSENWTSIHAIVADLTPYYETGIKFSYNSSEELQFVAILMNGWQNIVENNSQKSVGTQIKWTHDTTALINWSTYAGVDPANDGQSATRYWSDLYATYSLTDEFALMANFDFGLQDFADATTEDDVVWYTGIACRYQATQVTTVTARVETYQHPQGVTSDSWTTFGYTATSAVLALEMKPYNGVKVRLEGKHTSSPRAVYPSKDGPKTTDVIAMLSLSYSI